MTRSTCATIGCRRNVAVTHQFAPGDPGPEQEAVSLCLPCRKVIEFAMRIPWNDQADNWEDTTALREFMDDDEFVRSVQFDPRDDRRAEEP